MPCCMPLNQLKFCPSCFCTKFENKTILENIYWKCNNNNIALSSVRFSLVLSFRCKLLSYDVLLLWPPFPSCFLLFCCCFCCCSCGCSFVSLCPGSSSSSRLLSKTFSSCTLWKQVVFNLCIRDFCLNIKNFEFFSKKLKIYKNVSSTKL